MSKRIPLPDFLSQRNAAVDWQKRLGAWTRRLLLGAERLSLHIERLLARLIGDERLNPFYHTGTITVFLLLVILVTGVYLTMFYPFGFTLSYEAVSRIEANPIGRVVRALHRYASQAAVLAALLHAWRTFFQNRFRGARWLAWVTGVGLAILFWLIGVTGYWLIWDERAQVLTQILVSALQRFNAGKAFVLQFLVGERAGTGWLFMLFLLLAHLLLSAAVGLFLWWHLKRLSRAKWLPPSHWMKIIIAVLLAAALLFPAGMLSPFNPTRLPQQTQLDWFFLFYLPATLSDWRATFWIVFVTLTLLLALLPWLLRKGTPDPVHVDLSRCDGCTLCSRDCPYRAIQMVPRTDGRRAKWEAHVTPNLCVGCGVCVGSCPEYALSLDGLPIEPLWNTTLARVRATKPKKVVFACERHVMSGATSLEEEGALVVPLSCTAMVHPNLTAQVLQAGAETVHFLGCPPEDCANREGNLWTQERMLGERLPKLKPAFQGDVMLHWVAPGTSPTLSRTTETEKATAYGFRFTGQHGRALLVIALLSTITLAFQFWLGKQNVVLPGSEQATLSIALVHRSGYPIRDIPQPRAPNPSLDHPSRIVLEVDGDMSLDETYPQRGSDPERAAYIFNQVTLPAGEHHIRLVLFDGPGEEDSQVLFERTITLLPRQIVNLNYHDVHLQGDPLAGRKLYYEATMGTNAGCRICHSLEPGEVGVGPSLAGIATRAATRVPGMSAEEYLRQSILDPDAYVVPGFPKGQMVQNLGEILTDEQIDDLIAFLMTLK